MTRAVLDPNVAIAAALGTDGVPARCLRALAEGRFELVVSPALLRELRTVLSRKKFRPYLTDEQAVRLVDALARDAHVVDDPVEREALSPDPNDDYLIAAARSASAHVLVSGDNDLLVLAVPGLRIASPREFLDLLP